MLQQFTGKPVVDIIMGDDDVHEGVFSLVTGKVLVAANRYRNLRLQPYGRAVWMVYASDDYRVVLNGVVDGDGGWH